jgi:hypothetical protein
MAYVRKTTDTWEIQGFYHGSWELETTETSRKDAKQALRDYRKNMPNIPHRSVYKREKIEKGA